MKNTLLVVLVAFVTTSAFAWGHGPHGPHHPPPPPHHYYHHSHHHYSAGDAWAAAGIGIAAGAVGAALYNAVRPEPTVVVQHPAPVVVQQPVIVQQPAPVVVQQPAVVQQTTTVVQQPTQVWVEGRYIQQVQANGTVVQVWQPGHYEQR